MKKLLLLVIVISCLALCGCGGSNDDSGNGLNPEQQEYADVVYAFQTAVNDNDLDAALKLISGDVNYNKKSYNYKELRDRLQGFLEKTESRHLEILGIGVEVISKSDEEANVQADSLITYNYKGNESIKEILVFTVKKGNRSSTGIIGLKKYNPNDGSDVISAFPPVLE